MKRDRIRMVEEKRNTLGLDEMEEERSESFNQLPNIEKSNYQILDSSSVDLDVLLWPEENEIQINDQKVT